MEKEIFRQKSIEKVSSPESLNDYVKVASPSVWVILVGIIIFLIGVCVWGVMGRLDTKVNIGVTKDASENVCYIGEKDISKVKVGQKFDVVGKECEIIAIGSTPIQGEALSPVMLHALNLTDDDWVYAAKIKGNIEDGEYESYMITESVPPMSFVFN